MRRTSVMPGSGRNEESRKATSANPGAPSVSASVRTRAAIVPIEQTGDSRMELSPGHLSDTLRPTPFSRSFHQVALFLEARMVRLIGRGSLASLLLAFL